VELERREARLGQRQEIRRRAAVIENSGTLEELDREVGTLFATWSQEARRRSDRSET
jgi:hypothetical protein